MSSRVGCHLIQGWSGCGRSLRCAAGGQSDLTVEDGTHSGSLNIVKKFILHTMQNPQNEKSVIAVSLHKKLKNFLYCKFCYRMFQCIF